MLRCDRGLPRAGRVVSMKHGSHAQHAMKMGKSWQQVHRKASPSNYLPNHYDGRRWIYFLFDFVFQVPWCQKPAPSERPLASSQPNRADCRLVSGNFVRHLLKTDSGYGANFVHESSLWQSVGPLVTKLAPRRLSVVITALYHSVCCLNLLRFGASFE